MKKNLLQTSIIALFLGLTSCSSTPADDDFAHDIIKPLEIITEEIVTEEVLTEDVLTEDVMREPKLLGRQHDTEDPLEVYYSPIYFENGDWTYNTGRCVFSEDVDVKEISLIYISDVDPLSYLIDTCEVINNRYFILDRYMNFDDGTSFKINLRDFFIPELHLTFSNPFECAEDEFKEDVDFRWQGVNKEEEYFVFEVLQPNVDARVYIMNNKHELVGVSDKEYTDAPYAPEGSRRYNGYIDGRYHSNYLDTAIITFSKKDSYGISKVFAEISINIEDLNNGHGFQEGTIEDDNGTWNGEDFEG